MKRLHVHVGVEDLAQSIRFYSTLFAAEPTVRKPDYAKWMLENPRVNFAISHGRGAVGIHHLGIQVEDKDDLAEVYDRLKAAEGPVIEEGETACCYAQSEKLWIADPQGVAWETFFTHGESTVYGTSAQPIGRNVAAAPKLAAAAEACCGPARAPAANAAACCGPAAQR
jgi:catechol 2,3-dioxygenase-like lactoylglutathione lyase family enzyme